MTTRNTLACAGTLALALGLSGCMSMSEPRHPLDGTSWRLTDVETSGTSTQLTPQLSSRHTLSFERGGRLTAQLDCNRGTGSWSASQPRSQAGTITIGPVASTRALCPEPTFGGELAAQLPDATDYVLVPERNSLEIRTPGKLYVFMRN